MNIKEKGNIPLVSIGIPFYNAGKYLKYAILSVINQTYTNWELLLINDGSTDCSLDIVSEFRDKRIKLINDERKTGLPVRLNQLSKLANGEYYARMDADDIMHFQRIEKQVKFLQKYPEIDVVGTNSFYIDGSNHILGASKDLYRKPTTITDIINGGAFIHPSIMGKINWFLANPYDEKLLRMQDLALWLKTVANSNFYILQDNLLYYRAIEDSSLSKYLSTQKYFRKFILCNNYISPKLLACKLYLLSFCKTIIYKFFYKFNQINILISRRYNSLSLEDVGCVQKDLLLSIKE